MREMSRPHLVVFDLTSGDSHEIAFDEETYFLRLEPVYEFETSLIRFSYSSPATPQETYDYDVVSRQRTLVKRQTMPRGFDPQAYVARLVFAPADDGESVPVSLLHRRGAKLDGSAPMLITGYGAYGYAVEASFSTNRFSLVDRGFVFAIAHVRGGTDKGWRWYEDGKLGKKAEHLPRFSRRDAIPHRRGLRRRRTDRGSGRQRRGLAHGGDRQSRA